MSAQQVWQQLEGESGKAYEAFSHYRDGGAKRSIRSVALQLGKSKTLIERWSKRWAWVDRCAQYDQHMDGKVQAGREKAIETQADKWAQRQLEHRERAYLVSQKLLEKAEAMLNFPVAVTTTTGKNGEDITIKPAGWTFRDAAGIIEAADKTARLAVELPTECIAFLTLLQRKGYGEKEVSEIFQELVQSFADADPKRKDK